MSSPFLSHRTRQQGFTLVEIAIVLVIIGLLLGGILKGQELYFNSQIRSVVNEYNNVASAAFAYRDRYRRLPGDDARATARWSLSSSPSIGTPNNGTIDGEWDQSTAETAFFWAHLRNDELIAGPQDIDNGALDLPSNAFNGVIAIQYNALSGSSDPIAGHAVCQSAIPSKAAEIIDTRLDDTSADTGQVQGVNNTTTGLAAATPDETYKQDTPLYILCRQL